MYKVFLSLFLSCPAFASTTIMSGVQYQICTSDLCYKIESDTSYRSKLFSKKMLLDKVTLSIFKREAGKTVKLKELHSDRATLNEGSLIVVAEADTKKTSSFYLNMNTGQLNMF